MGVLVVSLLQNAVGPQASGLRATAATQLGRDVNKATDTVSNKRSVTCTFIHQGTNNVNVPQRCDCSFKAQLCTLNKLFPGEKCVFVPFYNLMF